MIYTFDDCELDTQRIILRRAEQSIRLRPKVFQMLTYLLEHRDRVIPKHELCDQVWPDQFISDATLESTIRGVRQVVGDSGRTQRIIATLHGHGYRFVADVEGPLEALADEATAAEPVASAPFEAPTRASGMVEPPPTILVVDDEILIVRHMEALLLPRGYKVITALHGAEALQQVQQECPDLVLLDVMMPGMDGFEVCRQLKDNAETRLIPVVLMTALSAVEDRIQGIEAGADDFLTKPVRRDELLARIRTSLRLKQTIDRKLDALQHAQGRVTQAPLFLTILRQGDTITVDLTEVAPVVPRGQIQIEESLLSEIGAELSRLTTLANQHRALSPPTSAEVPGGQLDDAALALQRLGALIAAHLFPALTRQGLRDAAPTDLFLRLDDQLVHLPWELAFDGQDFLLSKFRIGRQVMTLQRPTVRSTRDVRDAAVVKMLLVVDPTERIPSAAEEAEELRHLLSACGNLDVAVMGGKQLRKIDLLLALHESDLVHYTGDAYFDASQPSHSGWVLHDAVLTASELRQVACQPLLVFANACQVSTRSRQPSEVIYEGQAFGIGSAFVLAGAQNYLSTFCVMHNARSTAFAADFYRLFLQGTRVGEALSAARYKARQAAERRDLLWASHVHYGNPAFRLPQTTQPDNPLT